MGRVSRFEHLKDEALRRYAAGGFYTTIQRELGVPLSTMCRWAHEAGVARTQSVSKAMVAASNPSGARHLGYKCAFRGGKLGLIRCDSAYEYARLMQLEADASVASVRRCEDIIAYIFGGKRRSYNPDFAVTLCDGSIRVEEIKPGRFLSEPKTATKIGAGRAAYGDRYVVVTEAEIGADVIAAAIIAAAASNPDLAEHRAIKKHARRVKQTAQQKVYYRRSRAAMTPSQLGAARAYFAQKQREYREREALKNAA